MNEGDLEAQYFRRIQALEAERDRLQEEVERLKADLLQAQTSHQNKCNQYQERIDRAEKMARELAEAHKLIVDKVHYPKCAFNPIECNCYWDRSNEVLAAYSSQEGGK